jgi:CheY-like chemotaxis protein
MKSLILLIDDNKIDNLVFTKYFEESDFEIVQELNGKAALERLDDFLKEGRQPALIVVDIHMPFMNGFEFLEQYQEFYLPKMPNADVVALSSSLHQNDLDRINNFSFVSRFLTKPFSLEIRDEILKILDERRVLNKK